MTPRVHLQDLVLPDIEDLKRNPGDIRVVYHAIYSLYSLAACIYHHAVFTKPDAVSRFSHADDYRFDLSMRDGSFKLLREIARAKKYMAIDTESGRCMIAIDPPGSRDIGGVIEEALAFLKREMASLGM